MSNPSGGSGSAASGVQLHQSPVVPATGVSHTEEPTAASPGGTVSLDALGELPRSYGTDTIFLVAQEPHWLFTYWDIDISHHPGGPTYLRVYEGEERIEAEIEVPFETRNWYIPVKVAGAAYTVEIGYYRNQVWHIIARSVTILTPPDRMSGSESFDYATIPLHLSFQRLMESIQNALQTGETLIGALARLQRDGKLFAVGQSPFDLSGDQKVVLEALLGSDLISELSSGSFSSEEIEARIRQHLQEKLSSEGASELLARIQLGAPESSLFSALGALASAGVTSWQSGALSSWAAAALSSWAAAAQAQSSWSTASLSSWAEAIGSSWSAETLSSWLESTQSSWAAAALSSWNQSELTSWSQAATTSWFGASESVSSFGVPREFFMHVNAEVIFYGGTHPDASVTIDGKPIKLNPDGSFRYHFIFPNDAYEIPIVATSPDGVESRSATLRFQRQTEKVGKVDDTPQPPLDAPMGSQS